jgi:glycosyltransferase involved in cell wall biosynthesis
VIASRLSGIPELIRDGETGVLVRPGDAVALAQAFRQVLANPDDALSRARAGRKLIEQEFSSEQSADNMLNVFGIAS